MAEESDKLIMSTGVFQKRLMNVEEVAEYLGLKVNTIRAWIKRRVMPYVKINGAIRFDRCRIDEWIEQNKQEDINQTRIVKQWASLKS